MSPDERRFGAVAATLSFYEILTPPARPRRGFARQMGMTKRKLTPVRRGFLGLVVVASVALALTTATSDRARNRTRIESPVLAGSNVPPPVREILRRACQDCHSENTTWPWYARVPPISRQIHKDVAKGRAFMDLSKWNDYTEPQRRGFTAAIGAAVQGRLMPPSPYVWMHREARLSSDERELVKAWALAKNTTAAPEPVRSA